LERTFSLLDTLLLKLDGGVRTVFGRPPETGRSVPIPSEDDGTERLSAADRQLSVALLRVNHSGEVCAQALYQGQGLTARNLRTRAKLLQAAAEENDHLRWCEDRLNELGGRTSYLNPLWYLSSFGIGILAGVAGDGWNLGFLAETERQVVAHLSGHLQLLPMHDGKTAAILTQMREDEGKHATTAIDAGAYMLPPPVPWVMTMCSRVMTRLTYFV
jgi:3-demethoxyubiquinol 3-hydroxylase